MQKGSPLLAKLEAIRMRILKNTATKNDLDFLVESKRKISKDYYRGVSDLTDNEYDLYIIDSLKKLDPKNPTLNEVGSNHMAETELPSPCGSLINLHYKDGSIEKWLNTIKEVPYDREKVNNFIISQKLDGISILLEYREGKLYRAYKRGNGIKGQDITAHVKYMPSVPEKVDHSYLLVRGEAVMKEYVFKSKYKKNESRKKGYATSRNLVAGQFTNKVPNKDILADIDLITYEIKKSGLKKDENITLDKIKQLRLLNKLNFKVALYIIFDSRNFNANDFLKRCLIQQKKVSEYLMDGVVIDCNYSIVRKKLGYETNSINPKYARSFKIRTAEDEYTTEVEKVEWNVSKNGLVKPKVIFTKLDINGVSVSAATGKNAKTIEELGVGKGAVIKITRSGDAIPDILETVKKTVPSIIEKCPMCNSILKYTETGIDLYCPNKDCVGRLHKRILAFFRTIDTDYLNEGIINKCIIAGYDSFDKILAMSIQEFESLDRIGNKNAVKIYNSIRNACENVSLSKLMHATGFFGKSLGSTKLDLIIDFLGEDKTLNLSKLSDTEIRKIIENIKGFAVLSSNSFIKGIRLFSKWYEKVSKYFVVKSEDDESKSYELNDMKIVFSGFRFKEMENKIKKMGGKIVTSVSTSTTHVVVKDLDSNSSKVKKAKELGVKILSLDKFSEKFLG